MARVNGSIKNLVSGVTTLPAQRLGGNQFSKECINYRNDILQGLSKRAPFDWVETIPDFKEGDLVDTMTFGVETYIWIYRNNPAVGSEQFSVYDLDGNPFPTSVEGTTDAYLREASGDLTTQTNTTTFGDINFVTNGNRIVESLSDTRVNPYVSILNVKAPLVTGDVLTISMKDSNGTTGTHTVTGDTTTGASLDATFWAIWTAINGTTPATGVGAFLGVGNIAPFIYFRYTAEPRTDYVNLTSSLEIVQAINGTVGTIPELPINPKAPNVPVGIAVKPAGNVAASMYFEIGGYDTEDKDIWTEVAGYGEAYKLNSSTMPHGIVRNTSPTSFKFTNDLNSEANDWLPREVGNSTSSPMPEFVGKTINQLTVFQKRLTLLSGDRVIMSRTDNVFSFWRTTASQLLNSDPVSIGSIANEDTVFEHITSHNKDILIFSKTGQYKISGGVVLTPTTAAMVRVSTYETDTNAAPVSNGVDVYYPFHDTSNSIGINRFSVRNDETRQDVSQSITKHIQGYLKGTVKLLHAIPNLGIIFVVMTHNDTDTIYIGEWNRGTGEDFTVAWGKWTTPLNGAVSTINIVEGTKLVLTYSWQNSLIIVNMDLQESTSAIDTNAVYLDNRRTLTNVNTEIQLPPLYTSTALVVVGGPDSPFPNQIIPHRRGGSTNPVLTGAFDDAYDPTAYDFGALADAVVLDIDMHGGSVILGVMYDSTYIPAQPYIKDESGNIQSQAQITVMNWKLSLSTPKTSRLTSGYAEEAEPYTLPQVTVDINSPVRTYPTLEFNERGSTTSPRVHYDGYQLFNIPYRQKVGRADVIIRANSYSPVTLTELEWYGTYTNKGRRY